ncbi:putative uncharacterized protein [Brachyspira sp. CAG:484]|nr:putative uncharacterized protein [Brachyspira sp. CAG:484]
MFLIDKQNIGLVIKNARKKAGLKQYEVAEKAGFTEKHLSRIENGKYLPKLEHFLILTSLLNLKLEDFGIISSDQNISKARAELINRITVIDENRVQMYYEILNSVDKILDLSRKA